MKTEQEGTFLFKEQKKSLKQLRGYISILQSLIKDQICNIIRPEFTCGKKTFFLW
jgi:hypothetical protein